MAFKRKAASIHHELMFTRPIYGMPDIAELVDAGKLRTTLTERLSPINAVNLMHIHALLEAAWRETRS